MKKNGKSKEIQKKVFLDFFFSLILSTSIQGPQNGPKIQKIKIPALLSIFDLLFLIKTHFNQSLLQKTSSGCFGVLFNLGYGHIFHKISVFSSPFLGLFIILCANFLSKLPRFKKKITNFFKFYQVFKKITKFFKKFFKVFKEFTNFFNNFTNVFKVAYFA